MRYRPLIIVLAILLAVPLFIPGATVASSHLSGVLPTDTSFLPRGFDTLPGIIGFIFGFIITIAGTIFIILLLVGGIQYLTSAGNEEGTGKAKRLMVDAIVGLILTLAAWAIGTFIIGRLGLDSRFNRNATTPPFRGGTIFTQQITNATEFITHEDRCNRAGGSLSPSTAPPPPTTYTCTGR